MHQGHAPDESIPGLAGPILNDSVPPWFCHFLLNTCTRKARTLNSAHRAFVLPARLLVTDLVSRHESRSNRKRFVHASEENLFQARHRLGTIGIAGIEGRRGKTNEIRA